ncbi:hypothetical protein DEO72_LG11g3130 [Vigna unguiculata]|uniref:Uncharacterized protein n=1 Tax=Vigna unguiculata TaxID=3917 RepID=A0A4D6NW98_VIGUN|nr:hypothetical protein DEO72_LG11g3130 [Vigna unguiculata]
MGGKGGENVVLEAETVECYEERFTETQLCLLSVKKGGIEEELSRLVVIKEGALRTIKLSKESRNALFAKFVSISSHFWTSPGNRLAALMACQATNALEPILLVFPYELLGG